MAQRDPEQQEQHQSNERNEEGQSDKEPVETEAPEKNEGQGGPWSATLVGGGLCTLLIFVIAHQYPLSTKLTLAAVVFSLFALRSFIDVAGLDEPIHVNEEDVVERIQTRDKKRKKRRRG